MLVVCIRLSINMNIETKPTYNVFCNKPFYVVRNVRKSNWYTRLFNKTKTLRYCNSVETLCPECRKKRRLLCRNYHLYNSINMSVALCYYFKNISNRVLLQCVCLYGSTHVEKLMRSYYENLYIEYLDYNHEYFKSNTLDDSDYIREYDYALSGNNYWHQVLYIIILRMYNIDVFNTRHLEYLNLETFRPQRRSTVRSFVNLTLDA